MKEIAIIYFFGEETDQGYCIPLESYIEQNGIDTLETEIIIGILLNEKVEFDRNNIKVLNSETREWELLDEHFYISIDDLQEDDNCYNSENGIQLQLQLPLYPQYGLFQSTQNLEKSYLPSDQQFEIQTTEQVTVNPQDENLANGLSLLLSHTQDNKNKITELTSELEIISQFLQQFHNEHNQQIDYMNQQVIMISNLISQQQQQQQQQQYQQQLQIQSQQQQKQQQQQQQTQVKKKKPSEISFFSEKSSPKAAQVNLFGGIGQEDEEENDTSGDFFKDLGGMKTSKLVFGDTKQSMREEDEEDEEDKDNSPFFDEKMSESMSGRFGEKKTSSIIVNNQKSQPNIDSQIFPKPPQSFQMPSSASTKTNNSNDASQLATLPQPMSNSRLPSKMNPQQNSLMLANGISSNHNNRPVGNSKFGMKLSSIAGMGNTPLRMSIMYSEPLIKFYQGFIFPAGEPVEYEQEILSLTRYFQNVKNNIEITIRVANLDNLEEEIHKSQILHISCHGDYSKDLQKYYLAFETKSCVLDSVTTERFRILLQSKTQRPTLAFVNACHSEEVGQIFLDSGIPFVVAVQSNLKIQDKAAQIFSRSFYMELMQGNSIRQAFKSAKDSLIAKHHSQCYTCCCAHQHKDTCKWQEYALDNGYSVAHSLHEKFTCDCYNPSKSSQDIKNPIYHRRNCKQILEFFQELEYDQRLEELMLSDTPTFYGCCCQDEKTPHDESSKFKLLSKDSQDQTLQFEKGEIEIKQNFDLYNSQFRSQFKLFGRNMEMQQVFTYLSDSDHSNQFVVLYGERGSGLTSFAKKIARHLKEREVVNEIIIEDFENVDKGISKFKTKLKKYKNGNGKEGQSYTLMIMDNCDDLILKNKEDFTKQLQDCSLRVKFLIITHSKPSLKFPESVINSVCLKSLELRDAKDIIQHHLEEQMKQLQFDKTFLQDLDKLLNRIPIYPKFVMEIVQSIKNGSKLSDLLISSDPLDNLLRKLKETPDKYDMLLVICLFPHGISVEDLKYLASKKKIPSNWEQIMLQLTSKENKANFSGLNEDSQSSSLAVEEESKEDDLIESKGDNKFKIGQYFWMSVSLNELKMIQFKIKKGIPRQLYSKEEFSIDLLHKEVLILEFLSFFAKKILNCIKIEKYHKIKFSDYSSLLDFGLFSLSLSWKTGDNTEENLSNGKEFPRLKRGYSENFDDHIFKKFRKNLDSLFKLHEQNLYVYLKKEDLLNLIKFMNSSQCKDKKMLKDVLKDLCLDIPSIHKLLDHREDALEQCEKAICILDELAKYPDNIPYLLVKMKVLFLQANVYFDQFDFKTRIPEEFNLLVASIQTINTFIAELKKLHDFQNEKNFLKVVEAEKSFLVSYIIKILTEQRLLKYLEADSDLSEMNQLVGLLDATKQFSTILEICNFLMAQLSSHIKLLSSLQKSCEDSISPPIIKPLIAKLSFVAASLRGIQTWQTFNEEYVEMFQSSIEVFNYSGLNEMKETCLKQFIKLFLKNIAIQSPNSKSNKIDRFPSISSSTESNIFKVINAFPTEKLSDTPLKNTISIALEELDKKEVKNYQIGSPQSN